MPETKKNNNSVIKSKASVFCAYAIEGLWLFLLVATPIFYFRSHQSFNMPKTMLVCFVVGFMLVFWIIKSLEEKRFSTRWGIFGGLGLAYLVVLILSTIFSYYPSVSWWGSYIRFEGLSTYVFYIFAFFLVLWNIKTFAQAKRIFFFSAITTLPVSIYGLLQYFQLDFLKFLGTYSGFRTIISFLGNQLFLSDYLSMMIPIVITMFFIAKRVYIKIFWLLLVGINIWALVLTQRRSGFVALVAAALFGGIILLWRWRKSVAITAMVVLATIGIGTVLNFEKIADSNIVQSSPYLKAMSSIVDLDDTTIRERLLVWEITAGLIAERPIIGYGPETFLYVFDKNYPSYFTQMPENYFDRAHNFVLDAAFRAGILGALALLGLLGVAATASLRFFINNKQKRESYLGWGIFTAIITFFVHNQFMFENGTTRYIVFILIAVAGSYAAMLANEKALNEKAHLPQKAEPKLNFWLVREYKLIYYALLLVALAFGIKFHVFPIVGDYFYNKGLSYTQLEDREDREGNFLKAMYYIEDIRSAFYYQKLGSDYFIAAQNIEKGPVDNYFQKAIDWYQMAVEKDPKRERILSDMAQVYMVWSLYIDDEEIKNSKIELGEQSFERALELSPGRQMIYWEWGRSLIFIGKIEEGVAKYEYAVNMDDAVGRSYFELGKAYMNTNQEEEAREAFERARTLGWHRGNEQDPL